MCKSCGSNGITMLDLNIKETNTVQSLFDKGYVLVRYEGRSYATTIGSPTGVIAQDGLKNYGRGQSGDLLLVHPDDVKHSPTIFTVISKSTPAYSEALKKYNLVEKGTKQAEAKAEKTEIKSVKATKVVDAPEDKPKATVVPEIVVEKPLPLKEADKAEMQDTGGKVLSRSEALPLKDFTEQYGFTHHMQVLTKIRSGELKSFKDENDKTLVYHFDE